MRSCHTSVPKVCGILLSFVLSFSVSAPDAYAEKILAHDGDFTVFTDGRVAAFASYLHGDALPIPAATLGLQIPTGDGGTQADAGTSGTIDRMRIRSGLIGNNLGLGVRGPLTDYTTVKAYFQIWAWVESLGEDKTQINYADVRQGYLKLEGLWGSLLVGRSRGIFSRSNTDNDILLAHGYGVGYPGASGVDSNGPSQGQVGFGIIGSWFAAGIAYATPDLAGFQLNMGIFDPTRIVCCYQRTKWPRAEAELTYNHAIGQMGKFILFASGVYQTVYQQGQPESVNATAKGVAYGGRLDLGPAHLGVSGHYGKGLGLYNTLESGATMSETNELRLSDGYSVIAMVSMGRLDVSATYGITRVFMTARDQAAQPSPTSSVIEVLKHQQGIAGVAVFHIRPWLHLDVDVFRADFLWFYGDKQVDYIANAGMVMTW